MADGVCRAHRPGAEASAGGRALTLVTTGEQRASLSPSRGAFKFRRVTKGPLCNEGQPSNCTPFCRSRAGITYATACSQHQCLSLGAQT